MNAKDLGFELLHIGINQADAAESASTMDILTSLFGFDSRETNGSWFINEQFEIMKMPFRGRLGHIAVGTSDAAAARSYLESKGIAFEESTASYNAEGKLQVIYFRDDIAGFAFHLSQKK